MIIHFMRHGEAENANKDYNRPLSTYGVEQVRKITSNIPIDLTNVELWSSSAQRTKDTSAEILKKFQIRDVSYNDWQYLCAHDEYLQHLWKSDSDKDLLIVGHNPGISSMISYFLGEPVHMNTASFVSLKFENGIDRMHTSGATATMIYRFDP